MISVLGSGCPYIAEQPGTNRTSDDTSIDARVKYMCTEPDTAFNDDSRVYNVRCLPEGRWNKLPHPCQGWLVQTTMCYHIAHKGSRHTKIMGRLRSDMSKGGEIVDATNSPLI